MRTTVIARIVIEHDKRLSPERVAKVLGDAPDRGVIELLPEKWKEGRVLEEGAYIERVEGVKVVPSAETKR